MRLKFKNGQVDDFTAILSTRTYDRLGQIHNIDYNSFKVTCNLNSANEFSFDIYKELDGYIEPLWDDIFDLRLIFIKELNEYFEIEVAYEDKVYSKKTITGTSLCESELSQTNLYDIEINTENDIKRSDYAVTVFYNQNNKKGSLLHRILEKVPAYSIEYVDETLWNLQRTFSIQGEDIYSFLTGNCAKEFNCIFKFDSTKRTISVYDLYTVCMNDDCSYVLNKKMRYRGNFNDKCPYCNGTNLKYYGDDTTVFVSTNNLTDEIKYTTDVKSIKNCFRLEAGDENMTAAIMNINPNGSRYIYDFSPETLKDMPTELVEKLKDYDTDYQYYKTEYQINLNGTYVSNYNSLVRKYNSAYGGSHTDVYGEPINLENVVNPIIGHDILILNMYNCLDLYSYLRSSMMPNKITGDITATTEAKAIEDAYDEDNLSPFALNVIDQYTSKDTVTSSLINYVKVYARSGYVKIDTDNDTYTFNGTTGTWTGRFKVTSYSDSDDIAYTKTMTITVNSDYGTFMQEKLMKNLMLYDDDQTGNVYDVFSIKGLDAFKDALKLYSANRLKSFMDAFEGALTILTESGQSTVGATLYESFYVPYYDKFIACQEEYNLRNTECDVIIQYTSINGTSTLSGGLYKNMSDENEKIQQALNIETYLGNDLYKVFTTYRREDTYSNSNYISTGLTNEKIITNAIDYYEKAYDELSKSSTYQHSIDSNLYNLLLLEEFKSIVNYFELGNWIRIKVDNKMYRLRLTSYEINFGDLKSVNTQFSDVTQTADSMNDIQSLLSKTSKIASSYSAVTKQSSTGNLAYSVIQDWNERGLSSANTQIKSNDNEEILVTQNGILGRVYDVDTNTYSDEQIKITHNILSFTNDGWETTECALGKHTYKTYDILSSSFIDVEAYGLTAQFIQSGQINGSQIVGGEIYSSNYTRNQYGSYFDLDRGHLYLNSEGENKLSFNGTTLNIKGNIVATSLTLDSEIKINPTNIDLKDYTKNDISSSGYSFKVDSNGQLTASGANISGTIYASAGTIGGIKLNSSSIESTNGNFSVTSSGVLTAKDASITGSISSEDTEGRYIEMSSGKLHVYGKSSSKKVEIGTLSATGSASTGTYLGFSILAGSTATSLTLGQVNGTKTEAYYAISFSDSDYRHNLRDSARIYGNLRLDGTARIPKSDGASTYYEGYPVISDISNRIQLKYESNKVAVYVNGTLLGNIAYQTTSTS